MAKRLMRFGIVLVVLTTVLVLLKGRFDTWLALYLGGWSIFGLYAMVSIDDDLARSDSSRPSPALIGCRCVPSASSRWRTS